MIINVWKLYWICCLSLFLFHTHQHTNTHTLQGVSYCTDSPVSRSPPVSLTNSGRSVRSVTAADKPARRLKPWRETDAFLIAMQHNTLPQIVSICHVNTNTCWFSDRREMTNSWLTYVCVSLDGRLSSRLHICLISCICPPICRSLKWQISLLIVQKRSSCSSSPPHTVVLLCLTQILA